MVIEAVFVYPLEAITEIPEAAGLQFNLRLNRAQLCTEQTQGKQHETGGSAWLKTHSDYLLCNSNKSILYASNCRLDLDQLPLEFAHAAENYDPLRPAGAESFGLGLDP